MRIGLIDVDGHNFPNIPLMKISAWHKAQGHDVEWYDPMFSGHKDKVYMSKVFSFSPDFEYFINADEVVKGGERILHQPCGRERGVRQEQRHRASPRDRTHLPRLFPIWHYRHSLWIPHKRMPKGM